MKRLDYPAVGESVYTARLHNGLPVFVVPKPGYRRSFAVFAADYGGADRVFSLAGERKQTPAGVAHYLEHKMFDMPDGDSLWRMSAAGADPNAFTSMGMTAYHFECTDRFEENLRTLLSFVSTPYFTQASVDKERGIIAQEIRMYEDDPDFACYTALMKSLFRENPLRDSVAGTVESIQEITPQVLYDCHKVFYHPSNMALCVVGDVDPELVLRNAEDILTPDPAGRPGRDYGPEEGLDPVERLVQGRMDVSAPIFQIGAKLGPAITGPDALRERLTAGLALRCLCGQSSPFYLRHYSGGLLNAAFEASTDYAAGQGAAVFGGESADPRAVFDALCAEIEKVSREGFDPALFNRQKKAGYGGRIRAPGNFRGLAVSMIEGCFAGYQPMDAFELMADIRCEDAAAWVRERLAPERLAMSVIYPKEA